MDPRACGDCYYGQRINKGIRLCNVTPVAVPVTYMRQPDHDCGTEGALFEPIDSKAHDFES